MWFNPLLFVLLLDYWTKFSCCPFKGQCQISIRTNQPSSHCGRTPEGKNSAPFYIKCSSFCCACKYFLCTIDYNSKLYFTLQSWDLNPNQLEGQISDLKMSRKLSKEVFVEKYVAITKKQFYVDAHNRPRIVYIFFSAII